MTTIDEAIELGRRLREGSKEAAMKTDGLSEGSLEQAALERVDAIDASNLGEAVEARDAAESLLVVLGVMGAADAERRVAARLAEVDARMLSTRDVWGATAVKSQALRRIASLDASTWWLDLVALGAFAKAFEPAQVFRDEPPLLTMKLRGRSTAASLRLHAEVVGMDDDPARLAIERGAVIARMFDGEVEVFALGLRPDQDDLPAGLCVARQGGGVAGLTHVALGDVAGGQSQSGWWVPLGPQGGVTLVVRLGDQEESLSLDVTP